jgi:hypothetical protein
MKKERNDWKTKQKRTKGEREDWREKKRGRGVQK